MENIKLKLEYLINASNWKHEDTLFEDDSFRMNSFQINEEKYNAGILKQQLIASGIHIIHISLSPKDPSNVAIDCPAGEACNKGTFVTMDSDSGIWMPANPYVRKYDDHGRIIDNSAECRFTIPPGEPAEYSIPKNACLEFTLVQFTSNYDMYHKQITESDEIESIKVTKAKWFQYSNICDVFRYFVRGQFYQISHKEWPLSWPCQFLGYTLYRHMESLAIKTDKQVYSDLCDWIAYSTLISLPADGRWKHGVWTDENETHCIYQAKGIQLLIAYFLKSRKDIFKDKAGCALDYLVTVSDTVYDGLPWFLHDTLELSEEKAGLFYKDMFISKAFNKSPSNTLCINTHISALIAIHEYCRITQNPEYDKFFKDGIEALHKVLSEKPAGLRYWFFYKIRDYLNNYSGNIKLLKKTNKKYEILFKSGILPYLKKMHPRINMPQGFLERDLSNSHLSDSYHLVNLRDLIYLYDIHKTDWLYKIISKSTEYTIRYSIAENNEFDPRANIFLEILMLLSRYENKWDDCFRKQLGLLNEKNESLLVDVLCAACRENSSAASILVHNTYRLPCNKNTNNDI